MAQNARNRQSIRLKEIVVVDLNLALLTFPQTNRKKTYLPRKSFENSVGKREIARNEQFLLFPQRFLSCWRTFYHFFNQIKNRLQSL